MPLTDTAVRLSKPRDKDYTLNDTDGLALFVKATGSKYWHFRFSWCGKQPRVSLGTYPEISLGDARRLRDEARTQVAVGVDPRQHKKDQLRAQGRLRQNTFEAVANRWHAFKAPRVAEAMKKAAVQTKFNLDKDLIPVLGRLP
jgi:hypothetical protein